jgi:hypothetical protein
VILNKHILATFFILLASIFIAQDSLQVYKKNHESQLQSPSFNSITRSSLIEDLKKNEPKIFKKLNDSLIDLEKALFEKGYSDAKRNYGKYHANEFGIGLVTTVFSPLIGVLVAEPVASFPPKFKNLHIPVSIYSPSEAYYEGYTERAEKIKKKQVWRGFGFGTVGFFTVWCIVYYALFGNF